MIDILQMTSADCVRGARTKECIRLIDEDHERVILAREGEDPADLLLAVANILRPDICAKQGDRLGVGVPCECSCE